MMKLYIEGLLAFVVVLSVLTGGDALASYFEYGPESDIDTAGDVPPADLPADYDVPTDLPADYNTPPDLPVENAGINVPFGSCAVTRVESQSYTVTSAGETETPGTHSRVEEVLVGCSSGSCPIEEPIYGFAPESASAVPGVSHRTDIRVSLILRACPLNLLGD